MNKKHIIILELIIVLAVGLGLYYFIFTRPNNINVDLGAQPDIKNGTYVIEGKTITLRNGLSEEAVPGSASKIITRYFGNEVRGDFNNDGVQDMAFLLTQSGGGTGTFYYVAAFVSREKLFVGTNVIFIGDRIAPQNTEFRNGMIIVNFADRNPGEPFTAKPSLGVSKYFKIIGGKLNEIKLKMGESEAKLIAEKSCIKGGEALSTGTYNENSKTWWFDANLNATKEGCSPACVVSSDTKKAEVNWRCTGLTSTPINNQQIYCTPESRKADVCTMDINRVCATVNIQCIKAPCNPIQETFNNSCEACRNQVVSSYSNGACESIPITIGKVKGRITLSPTCPVERIPPDPACAPKPYATTIQIILFGSLEGAPFTTTESDKDGKYSVSLPPGKYSFQPIGNEPLPTCGTQEVAVVASKTLEVNLSCDTGIR